MTGAVLVEEPIFVVGSARSGTVQMGRVLKRHPQIHCLIERLPVFHYASFLGLNPSEKVTNRNDIREKLRLLYAENWAVSKEGCQSCSEVCRDAGNIGKGARQACGQEKTGPLQYADKSHQHVLNVDVLLEAFPRARFIHLIRDGRAVVSSMLRHNRVLAWFSPEIVNETGLWPQPWFGIRNAEHFKEWREWSVAKKCSLRWVSWVEEGLKASRAVGAAQWMDVRYEEWANDPIGLGKQIFEFLRLDFDPDFVSDVFAGSIDAWRGRLDPHELKDALTIMGPMLVELGYA